MKHKSALTMHLQRFQNLKKELTQRKDDVLEELSHLHRLYNDTLTRINTNNGSDQQTEDRSDANNHDNVVKEISLVFEQTRCRLKNMVTFLDSKVKELLKIKRTFQNEYPLMVKELVKRDLTTPEEMDNTMYEEFRKKKDAAALKMTVRLKTLRQSVNKRLDMEYGRHELEELLAKLKLADSKSQERSRSQTKLPLIVVSPHASRTSKATGLKRSSSVSKERLLNKAKLLRATRKTPQSSSGSSLLTSPSTLGQSFSSTEQEKDNSADNLKTPTLDSSQDTKGDESSSLPKTTVSGKQDGNLSALDCKDQLREIIQVQEVTSSVQDRLKTQSLDSFGDSLTESSIMTSSTVSAVLGDSSLQTSPESSENSDVKQGRTSDSSVESATGDDHKSVPDTASKHHAALLSRQRSTKGGSRYIQIGLPAEPRPFWEGRQGLKGTSSRSHPQPYYPPSYSLYQRGGRPSQRRMPGPYGPWPRPHRRSQSCHSAYRQPWYPMIQEYFPHTRRSQSAYPGYPDHPRGGFHRGPGYRYAFPRRGESCPGFLRSYRQELTSWPAQHVPEHFARGSNGTCSVDSRSSSISPTTSHENGSDERCDEELPDAVNGCLHETEEVGEDLVTVRLVTTEHVQKHRGPGLMDHRTQADNFVYPKDKTLDELMDFIHGRMKVNGRGRIRLWLFEEDADGLFLPRRILMGTFARKTLGSLNTKTVTLFVQMAEPHERFFTFDHQKVRFVFIKTPHWDTGEFVVKGHHQIDITKATRAIVQILKKKFMPQSPSSLRLYVETGGKKMYCVPHNAVSTFREDTEWKSRHGDILVLLEDFIDQQTARNDVALSNPYLGQSVREGGHLLPLSPLSFYRQVGSQRSAVVSSCNDSVCTSDEQDSPGSASPPSPTAPAAAVGGLNHDHDHLHHQQQLRRVQDEEEEEGCGGGVSADQSEHKMDNSTTNVNFVIPFDSTTSASDESLSPISDASGNGHKCGGVQGRQAIQWNLTNNYMSRFSQIKEEEGDGPAQPVVVTPLQSGHHIEEMETVAEEDSMDRPDTSFPSSTKSKLECVDYDHLEVSGRLEMASVEYESVMVSNVREELTSQDSTEGGGGGSVNDSNGPTVQTTQVSSLHSSLQLTSTDPRLVPSAVMVAEKVQDLSQGLQECARFSVTGEGVSACHDQLVVATINVCGQNQKGCVPNPVHYGGDGGRTPTTGLFLNPVAPIFTPRTLLRMQQLRKGFTQQNLKCNNSCAQGDFSRCERKGESESQEARPVSFSPKTPHSGVSGNSMFTCDEDASVYYTPRPAFVFPDAHTHLQSTAIPLTDMNNSQNHSQLNPDQISAITNCSSSFMAIRLPRQPSGGAEQISAIPNISSSFMEIPSQHQLHNSSLPGHSTSICSFRQRHNVSPKHDPPFGAPTSPRHPHTIFDTSHLQAHSTALPIRPTSPARAALPLRGSSAAWHQTEQKKGKPSKPTRENMQKKQAGPPRSEAPLNKQGEEKGKACTLPRSEASVVKREDPAIMDIGKQVLVMAQKSSLNANAMEFVPKDVPAALKDQAVKAKDGFVNKSVEGGACQPAPPPNPYPYGGHPLVAKLYSHGCFGQQQGKSRGFCPAGRTTPQTTKPVSCPTDPRINRVSPNALYNTVKLPSSPLTNYVPKLPILVSLTDGSHTDLPPKQRSDTSRHVTFADPPIKNGRTGVGRTDANPQSYNHRHNAYAQPQAPYGSKPVHPTPDEAQPSSHSQEVVPLNRRKIGSGRFDDRPKRYTAKSLQRDGTRPQPQTPGPQTWEQGYKYDHRKPPLPPYPKPHNYYNGPIDHGNVGSRFPGIHPHPHPATHKRSASFGGRDMTGAFVNGTEHAPFSSHHRMDHHRLDPQTRSYPYGNAAPSFSGNRFSPEDRWGGQGHGYMTNPRPHSPYRPPRSSLKHTHSGEFQERGPVTGEGGANGTTPAVDFRFRRPIRVAGTSNSSSDQASASFYNRRRTYPRFRRVNRPINESEMEASSLNVHSESSHHDSATEPSADTNASDTPSAGSSVNSSSESKTSQSSCSGGSRQSLRVRRGYIQLGLGQSARPTYSRAASDPNL